MNPTIAEQDLSDFDFIVASNSEKVVMLEGGRIFCEGRPFDVITAENIKAVYKVNATVIGNNGYPCVLPETAVS